MKSTSGNEEVSQLVDEAANAFDRGAIEQALTLSESACAADPGCVPALHYRAAALAELDRLDDARKAYEIALKLGSRDLDLLLGAADFYINRLPDEDADRESLERGLELARQGGHQARRTLPGALAAEFLLLEGIALNQLGESRDALARIDQALADLHDNVDAKRERGLVLYELCRFEDARAQLEEVIRLAPEEAWAHHTLGLIAEREHDSRKAERHFAQARRLAPDEFPAPTVLTQAAFDAAVEDALASLPEQIRRYLSNVAIAVEDLPDDDDLVASEPPLSPSILGVFRGAPFGEKASMDPWSHFPSSIVLYQKNLERFARDRKELVEQIGITLIHEVGHFLGLDEEGLWERGLE